MNTYFAYIRVSTAKQGERGVSLDEQKSAIVGYSVRNKLDIAQWFEERETAAKRGRPVFTQLLRLLQRGRAKGVIIHKIDRSARNLRDWADLGELIDRGYEIHFANESLDMASRGGRLSADIQAVVAADYIRNLKEEARKGFYGRLKQGYYPLPAPLGYLDKGGGKLKVFDPAKYRQVKKLFELYTTGEYSLIALAEEANRMGLRSKTGKLMTDSTVHHILTNPFYMGLVRIKTTNELFPGGHERLITKSLFDKTKAILSGKSVRSIQHHGYLFRRLLRCKECKFSLIGERQKGNVYYRCHTKDCVTKSVREEVIKEEILRLLLPLKFSDEQLAGLDERLLECKRDWINRKADTLARLKMDLSKVQEKRVKLTDVYLDDGLSKDLFEMRYNGLLLDMKDIEERIQQVESGNDAIFSEADKFLELLKTAYFKYEFGITEEKREIVKSVTSNRYVVGKSLDFTLSIPFQTIADGDPSGAVDRFRIYLELLIFP